MRNWNHGPSWPDDEPTPGLFILIVLFVLIFGFIATKCEKPVDTGRKMTLEEKIKQFAGMVKETDWDKLFFKLKDGRVVKFMDNLFFQGNERIDCSCDDIVDIYWKEEKEEPKKEEPKKEELKKEKEIDFRSEI